MSFIFKNLEADNKTQYLLQKPHMHGVFTLLFVYWLKMGLSAGWLAAVRLRLNLHINVFQQK